MQPLAADNRVTHDLVSVVIHFELGLQINSLSQNPASLTYDEVTINSEKVSFLLAVHTRSVL